MKSEKEPQNTEIKKSEKNRIQASAKKNPQGLKNDPTIDLISAESKARFEAARTKIVGIERERRGIGTLAEKTVHAILKNY